MLGDQYSGNIDLPDWFGVVEEAWAEWLTMAEAEKALHRCECRSFESRPMRATKGDGVAVRAAGRQKN